VSTVVAKQGEPHEVLAQTVLRRLERTAAAQNDPEDLWCRALDLC
jgi:hypothetical protein